MKNPETLIDARKEAGLEENAEKISICYCLITRMQGRIMITNISFENMAQYKYLRTTVTI
jgi:hypothetical protein